MSALLPQRRQPFPGYESCAGRRQVVPASRPVVRLMHVPEKVAPSVWSAEDRRMPSADAEKGRWRRELAPHSALIMDIWAKPWVRELWFCGPDQASKTNTMLSCIGWSILHAPGNIFYTMPTEKAAGKIWSEKLMPMLRLTRSLAKRLSKKADDTSLSMIRMPIGVSIYPAWANSATSTATFSAKYTFNDEVDKWEMVGKEADPVRRIRKRAKNFKYTHKHFFSSTPAGKYIYKGMMACQQVLEYAGRCPHCGQLVVMDKDHLDYPADLAVDQIKTRAAELGYCCNACSVVWDEADRQHAFDNGDLVAIKGADIKKPESVGIHLTGLITPDMIMTDIVEAVQMAKNGDLSARRDLAHGVLAEDYEPPKAASDHLAILALCDDRPRDLVPTGTAALALQVDTQQNGFYYELAAVAYGDAGTSHLVSKGFLLNFDDLLTLSQRTWTDENKKEYQIHSALIDSGGTRKAGMPPKHSRTKEVYEFCKKNPVFIPVKGTGRKDTPVKYTTLTRWPGTSKPIPGGLILVVLDVHYYKDDLAGRLALHPEDPGAFVLYSGYTQGQLDQQGNSGILPASELEDYAKHLCSEYRDELMVWHHDQKAGRNDYADCATYRMFHIELLKQQGRLAEPKPEPRSTDKTEKKTDMKSRTRQSRRW